MAAPDAVRVRGARGVGVGSRVAFVQAAPLSWRYHGPRSSANPPPESSRAWMNVITAARRLCLPLLVAATPIGAQAPRAIPVNVTAMRRLDFLLGEWEGDGWILQGRGERRTFHQRETVRSAAGGTVVVIDGLGTSTDAGREGETVHQAFALVTYDSVTAKLRWRAYRATGEET